MVERHVNYAASVVEDLPSEAAPRRASGGAGFQVSLAALIWIMSALAVLLAALFAFPPVLAAIVALLLSVCIPGMLVACIVYGGPAWRAFAIGALAPSVLRMYSLGPFSISSRASVEAQMMIIRNEQGVGWRQGGRFDIHSQMIDLWNKTGSTMLADECIFWGASAVAGLAALWVQRMFGRRSLPYGGPSGRG
jgi:hypothetical protein